MTAGELKVGQRFQLPEKRAVYIKILDYGQLCHVLTRQELPGGAHIIQHDDNGNPIYIPHITAQKSNKMKFDLPKDREVISVTIK